MVSEGMEAMPSALLFGDEIVDRSTDYCFGRYSAQSLVNETDLMIQVHYLDNGRTIIGSSFMNFVGRLFVLVCYKSRSEKRSSEFRI